MNIQFSGTGTVSQDFAHKNYFLREKLGTLKEWQDKEHYPENTADKAYARRYENALKAQSAKIDALPDSFSFQVLSKISDDNQLEDVIDFRGESPDVFFSIKDTKIEGEEPEAFLERMVTFATEWESAYIEVLSLLKVK